MNYIEEQIQKNVRSPVGNNSFYSGDKIIFDKNLIIPHLYQKQIFWNGNNWLRKFGVSDKTPYWRWDYGIQNGTRMGSLNYQQVRGLVKTMETQEGFKTDSWFYYKYGAESNYYDIRRIYNLKKGRQKKCVMWRSIKQYNHRANILYLGGFWCCPF